MGVFSKLFGNEEEDAFNQAMEKIRRLIEDEEYQNNLLPEALSALIKAAPACDVIPGATGQFGLDITNPIPVNGAIGELAYLSNLETLNCDRLLFHRIGAVNTLDVFEAVTFSGSAWFIFFVDFYHPRKSRRAPEGFRLAQEARQFSGFHKFCPNFPYDFAEQKQSEHGSGLSLAYIAMSKVMEPISQRKFNRPLAHKAKLSLIEGQMTSRST